MAPPKKFKNSQEVLDHYGSLVNDISDGGVLYSKANALITAAFLSGVEYEDSDGKKVTTPQQSEAIEKDESARMKISAKVFAKGTKTLLDIANLGSTQEYMFMFCRTKGFTSDDFIEIGEHPDSDHSKKLLKQIGTFKQKFTDMINSNDPELLSDFFIDVMKQYKKELPRILKCDTAESYAKNWKFLNMWRGSGAIQQCIEGDHNEKTETQARLLTKLEEKLKSNFGPDMEISSMIGLLQPIHVAMSSFSGKYDSPESITAQKDLDSTLYSFNAAFAERLASAVRPIKMMNLEIAKLHSRGENAPLISNKLGKVAALGSGQLNILTSDEALSVDSPFMINNLKYMAGDNSGRMVYNTEFMDNYQYETENGKTKVNTNPKADYLESFFSENQILSDLKDLENFNKRMQKKYGEKKVLTNTEIALLMHPDNTVFQKNDVEKLNIILGNSPVPKAGLRWSTLSDPLRHIVTSIAHNDFDMEPEEYISGAGLIRATVKNNFRETENAINNDLSAETLDFRFQKKITDTLNKTLSSVGVTVASSKEFKDLDKAFKEVSAMCAGNQVNRQKYEDKLRALYQASDKYIDAKKADGKKERFSDKGQIRLNLAKKMLAFAHETLNGIARADKALANAPTNFIDNWTPAPFETDAKVSDRIKNFFGTNPIGNEDCVNANVYKKAMYKPEKIDYPANMPFTDDEIAIIGVAAITNGANLGALQIPKKDMTKDETGMRMFTHTVTDPSIALRINSLSEKLLNCYNAARQEGVENVKKFMKDDPEPLAKMLGRGIKAICNNCLTAESMTEEFASTFAMAQKMMGILKKHDGMIAMSGLDSKNLAEFRSLEKYLLCYQFGKEAKNKLKENKDLTPEEDARLIAERLANKVIQGEVSRLRTKCYLDKGNPYTKELMQAIAEYSNLNQALSKLKSSPDAAAEKQSLITRLAKAEAEKEMMQFRIEQYTLQNSPSPILSAFAKGSDDFATQRNKLIRAIQETPAFKKLMSKPNRLQIVQVEGAANELGEEIAKDIAESAAQKKNQAKTAPQVNASMVNKSQINAPQINANSDHDIINI